MRKITPTISLSFLTAAVGSLFGGGPAYTDPSKVDRDFTYQGEYAGDIQYDGQRVALGAQVIALGKGQFRLAIHVGGLPGDG